ncbi:hypothetical protein C8R47DRAFT_1064868 [Mycena vitilis]|nr:hypothetical protein C8R47DRAFT_1064868 [Mycena vitilis]
MLPGKRKAPLGLSLNFLIPVKGNLELIHLASPGKKQPWMQIDEPTRISRTVGNVKQNTKQWTVGWADFCGHAQAFGTGVRGGLCRWDPGLTPEQRKQVESHWERRGLYEEGMRKLPKVEIPKEHNWRKAVTDPSDKKRKRSHDEGEAGPPTKRRTRLEMYLRRVRREESSPEFRKRNPKLRLFSEGGVLGQGIGCTDTVTPPTRRKGTMQGTYSRTMAPRDAIGACTPNPTQGSDAGYPKVQVAMRGILKSKYVAYIVDFEKELREKHTCFCGGALGDNFGKRWPPDAIGACTPNPTQGHDGGYPKIPDFEQELREKHTCFCGRCFHEVGWEWDGHNGTFGACDLSATPGNDAKYPIVELRRLDSGV